MQSAPHCTRTNCPAAWRPPHLAAGGRQRCRRLGHLCSSSSSMHCQAAPAGRLRGPHSFIRAHRAQWCAATHRCCSRPHAIRAHAPGARARPARRHGTQCAGRQTPRACCSPSWRRCSAVTAEAVSRGRRSCCRDRPAVPDLQAGQLSMREARGSARSASGSPGRRHQRRIGVSTLIGAHTFPLAPASPSTLAAAIRHPAFLPAKPAPRLARDEPVAHQVERQHQLR